MCRQYQTGASAQAASLLVESNFIETISDAHRKAACASRGLSYAMSAL